MNGIVLGGQHFLNRGAARHGIRNGILGRFIVVAVDLGIILGAGRNKHAADDHEIFCLVSRNDTVSNRICNCLGNGSLGWTEHLQSLRHALDRDLGNHHGCRLDCQVGSQYSQQIVVAGTLTCQGIGKGNTDRSVLASD